MATYRVEAPYATLKMTDGPHGVSVMGFYQGAIVDGDKVDKESLKRLVKRGMVKRLTAAEVAKADPEESKGSGAAQPAKKAASPPKKQAEPAAASGSGQVNAGSGQS